MALQKSGYLPPALSMVLIMGVAIWYIFSVRLANDFRSADLIQSDGKGYYAYLPAYFIYDDFEYRFSGSSDKYPGLRDGTSSYISGSPSGLVNKYYVGVALCQLPFFLIADQISLAFGLPRDGYANTYALLFCIGALFYLFLGMTMLWRFLSRMGFTPWVVSIVLLCIFFGTNLFHYSVESVYMSHLYSFAFLAWFLCEVKVQLMEPRQWRWLLLSFIATMVIIIRPVNVVLLLSAIPLSGSFRAFGQFLGSLFANKLILVLAVLIFLLPIGIQSYMYYLQTGAWWVYSYGEEGFNFLAPAVLNVLFSWNKGLFIYTPVLLAAFLGLLMMPKRFGRFTTLGVLVTLALFTWVVSSWWNWWYGWSFGMRAYIEAYALLALPMSSFVSELVRKRLPAILALCFFVFCIWLNLFQTWQLQKGIFSWHAMDFDRYVLIFGQTGNQFAFIPYEPESELLSCKRYATEELRTIPALPSELKCWNSAGVLQLGFEDCMDYDLIRLPCDSLWEKINETGVVIQFTGRMKLSNNRTPAEMVVTLENEQGIYHWEGRYLIHAVQEENVTRDVSFCYKIPPCSGKDRFTLKVHSHRKSPIELSNLQVTLLKPL